MVLYPSNGPDYVRLFRTARWAVESALDLVCLLLYMCVYVYVCVFECICGEFYMLEKAHYYSVRLRVSVSVLMCLCVCVCVCLSGFSLLQ